MAGPKKHGKDAKKGINLPGVMLDELRELGMSSERPQSGGNKRKSGGSRKEQRKQERQLKKQKTNETKKEFLQQKKQEKLAKPAPQKKKAVVKATKKVEKKEEKPDPAPVVSKPAPINGKGKAPEKGLLRLPRTPASGRSVTWAAKDHIREFGHSLDGEKGQEYEQCPEERAEIKRNTYYFDDDEEDTEEDEPELINQRVNQVMQDYMGEEGEDGDLDEFMAELRAKEEAEEDDDDDESDDNDDEELTQQELNQQAMSLKRLNTGTGTASGGLTALRKRGPSVSEDIPGSTRASKSFSFSEDYGNDDASTDDDEKVDDSLSVEDTMALLKAKKAGKSAPAASSKRGIEEVESESEDSEDFDMSMIPPDDELDSDDFDSDIDEEDMLIEDEDDEDDSAAESDAESDASLDDTLSASDTMALLMAKKKAKNAKPAKTAKAESDDESDVSLDDSMSASDTMALLMAKKKAKNAKPAKPESDDESDVSLDDSMSAADTMALLKAKKAKKADPKPSKSAKAEPKYKAEVSDLDSALMRKDEEEMEYYAKKLGFKNAKSANFGSDDELDGILDGLDVDFGFDSDEEAPELVADKKPKKEKKEKKAAKKVDNDLPWSEDEVDSDDFDTDSDSEPRVKENPYVAPVDPNAPAKYVPPSLRKKLTLDPDTQEMVLIRRKIKGSLNKLSESNIGSIINEILRVFDDNPRLLVTTVVTECLLESTASETILLETFLLLHAVIATILYRQIGISFGAYFVQSLVEKFFANYATNTHRACSNLLAFLTEVYYFQMVSCTLVYDLIKKFLADPNERNTEYLLKIVRFSGSQLRSDDPSALKTIINDLQASLATTETNTRTKFLVESVAALKNNRQNQHGISQGYTEAKMRLKKFIGGFSSYTVNEPISVSLDDIENIETRGKWWLVGAAFKNQDQTHAGDDEIDMSTTHDILDAAEPNWLELAREQRMNTDIRRAVFVAIMGAEDYLNALERVTKLRLKRVQEREIPRVLIHCCSNETVYNPFYALLAVKLSERHSLKMTFQFTLWDFFRELDGDEDDDDESDDEEKVKVLEGSDSKELLRKTMNLARMFAQMTAEGVVGMSIFKNVNFLTASENMKIFLEMYFVALFGMLGKRAEEGNKKSRDQKQLVKMLLKMKDNPLLLRGIQYFVSEIVVNSDLIVKKREKERVLWGRDVTTDMVDELTKAA